MKYTIVRPYIQLMRLDKPIGIYLLLWPTLSALWIAAKGLPDIDVLCIFFLGVVLMRSAGCVINDYADRKVDGFVKRTSIRPLVTGQVAPISALKLFCFLIIVAFLLVLMTNQLTVLWACVALLLAVCYPFAKRYIKIPQAILGLAFSCSIPMAFAAQMNHVPSYVLWFVLANLCWTIAYDTLYAMVDREDDINVGIYSTAVWWGRYDRWMIALFQALAWVCWWFLGSQSGLSFIYFFGLIFVLGLFCYQHWLIRHRQTCACFKAFLNNNWIGFVIWFSLLLSFMI